MTRTDHGRTATFHRSDAGRIIAHVDDANQPDDARRDDAVSASQTNPLSAHIFLARTENIQVHRHWGVLLSRLWVQ
jgi:hypothetical protein